jgi:hypothetical protein
VHARTASGYSNIGLINTLEAVDLADAYRHSQVDEDDIDFVDDV